MKKPVLAVTTAILAPMAACFATGGLADTLRLSVATAIDQGNVRAAVYASAEAFENGDVAAEAMGEVSSGTALVEIKGLNPGRYGIALFQDLNKNEILDRNLFGAPTEPFGFSNNPIIKFTAPKFEEFQFDFTGNSTVLNIQLNGG